MALQTYDDLIATTADWLMRDDLLPIIPVMIRLAESQLDRRLRLGPMITRTTVPIQDGVATLPDDVLEVRSVETGQGWTWDYMAPVEYGRLERSDQLAGTDYFTVEGRTLRLLPRVSGDLTVTYYAAIPPLGPDRPTNWLLEQFPDLLMYMTLMQSAPYLSDDQRGIIWKTLADEAVAQAEEAGRRADFPGPLVIRAG